VVEKTRNQIKLEPEENPLDPVEKIMSGFEQIPEHTLPVDSGHPDQEFFADLERIEIGTRERVPEPEPPDIMSQAEDDLGDFSRIRDQTEFDQFDLGTQAEFRDYDIDPLSEILESLQPSSAVAAEQLYHDLRDQGIADYTLLDDLGLPRNYDCPGQ